MRVGIPARTLCRDYLPLPIFRTINGASGLRDVRIPMMAIYSLSPKWHIAGGLIYSRLVGDASDSPVVDERGSRDQLFAGLGVAYAW